MPKNPPTSIPTKAFGALFYLHRLGQATSKILAEVLAEPEVSVLAYLATLEEIGEVAHRTAAGQLTIFYPTEPHLLSRWRCMNAKGCTYGRLDLPTVHWERKNGRKVCCFCGGHVIRLEDNGITYPCDEGS